MSSDKASSSYEDWGAVHASLVDAQKSPPKHLDGELSTVYDWPDEPVAGAMLVSDPMCEKDDGVGPTTAVVLLLQVTEQGAVNGVCLNTEGGQVPPEAVPVGLEDVPIRCGGDVRRETVVGLYPTPDGRDDSPRINMDGLSHVFGGNEVLRNVLWGQTDKEKLRLYAGVHSWNPGCLEAEIKDARWLMIMATKNFVFDVPPSSLYYHLMERLGYM